jgi:hypothetical protein
MAIAITFATNTFKLNSHFIVQIKRYFSSYFSYSRLLVRHHWLVLGFVVFISITLTIVAFAFTQLPDFSDPRSVKYHISKEKRKIFNLIISRDGVHVEKVQFFLN